jgi:hypothetical protein
MIEKQQGGDMGQRKRVRKVVTSTDVKNATL